MADVIKLKAASREKKGTSAVRRLRHTGRIPAVAYNSKGDNLSLELDEHDFALLVQHHGASMVLALDIESDKERNVLIKDIQHHPVSGRMLHVDFMEISLTETQHVSVPIMLVGDSAGVDLGGTLEQLVGHLDIECLPTNLPESIEIDVTALGVGDRITVADLDFGDQFTFLTDPGIAIAHVSAPRKAVAADGDIADGDEGKEPAAS
jgi:large subunit ribosomal protein L25